MTSKFRCPVCQNNLHKINVVVSTCTNDKCKLWGSSIPNLVLEALTQAKQDLEQYKHKDNLQQQLNANNNQIQEKYKQIVEIDGRIIENLEKDLEIARNALESISGIRGNIEDYYGGVSIHYQQMVLHMDEIATNALAQMEHIADISKMIEHKE